MGFALSSTARKTCSISPPLFTFQLASNYCDPLLLSLYAIFSISLSYLALTESMITIHLIYLCIAQNESLCFARKGVRGKESESRFKCLPCCDFGFHFLATWSSSHPTCNLLDEIPSIIYVLRRCRLNSTLYVVPTNIRRVQATTWTSSCTHPLCNLLQTFCPVSWEQRSV